jgi:hypothetical protein
MNFDLAKLVAEVGLVTAFGTILIFMIVRIWLKYIYEREIEKN